jgi:hypothetical protein
MKRSPTEQSDGEHLTDAQLATLATTAALGQPITASDASHLEQCAICKAAAADLTEMVAAAFSGDLVPVTAPALDLSFLRRMVRSHTSGAAYEATRTILGIGDLRAISGGGLGYVGASRGDLIGRYKQSLSGPDSPSVTVEVIATDTTRAQGHVRIAIDTPSRDPFDQSGNRVTLRVDGQLWRGETDQNGLVELGPVPVAALPRMRIEIEA